ncbi:MAG: ArsI/CadI family heavy metal resistance metalloenzyme [Rudaea sp.]|nr:ArsI/CadI family heavy metal resistance metalloenzyme [Rudaea sp.]
MKRFHVHVNVRNLDASIGFYSQLFGSGPSVLKPDYAKWILDDPRLNFAISQRERAAGVDHLGLQADNAAELAEIGARLTAADAFRLAETGTTCCYAKSDKYWAEDPQGVRWESFFTHAAATTYSAPTDAAACCTPASKTAAALTTACCGPSASSNARCG